MYTNAMKTTKVLIATDHAGFELKNALVEFVRGLGYEVVDMGAHSHDEGDDYAPIMAPVAMEVSRNPDTIKAIVIGGSGNGEAIVCNRHPGVRAAVYYGNDLDIIKLSRQHNDANILSLGARFLTIDEAKEAVQLWLFTGFSNEKRHIRRITQIDTLE
jgi:ribose 5-phosphate isomerase B